jgi:hemerythrin
MSSFTWLDAYKIGDDTIDRQHQYLFDLANQIVDPFNDAQKTHLNVLALYHYFREHFKDEESLMKQYDYAGYEEHVKKHEELTQKLTEISTGILSGEIGPDDVIVFMNSWVCEHILGEDLLLGDFLRQQKIKEIVTEE